MTRTRTSNSVLAPYRRPRPWLALGLVLVVALGLASRAYPALFPASLGSYTGDALWALMVFLGIAFFKPALSRTRLAGAALAFAWLVEASQLYQAPWINALRATTPGHLVLGTGFQWLDLVAYAAGIACGFLGDCCSSPHTVERSQVDKLINQ
ncbi:DUF2809 domain-containing protein [Massilia sp. TSP1-1-2]|uniref:ribosomal maturation YjgA family protein n=1 Tax=unclassified Massilia TaxID=2609279 RepID=UPI003CF236F4